MGRESDRHWPFSAEPAFSFYTPGRRAAQFCPGRGEGQISIHHSLCPTGLNSITQEGSRKTRYLSSVLRGI